MKRIKSSLLSFAVFAIGGFVALVSLGFFATMGLAVALFAVAAGAILFAAAKLQEVFGRTKEAEAEEMRAEAQPAAAL